MKNYLFCIFITLTLIAPKAIAQDRVRDRDIDTVRKIHSYVAFGPNFAFPGAIRVGYKAWEAGLLSPGFLGIDKIFEIGNYTYSSFGFGFSANDFSSSAGLQVAIGINFGLVWGIGIRGEFIGRALFDGSSIAHGLVGVSSGF